MAADRYVPGTHPRPSDLASDEVTSASEPNCPNSFAVVHADDAAGRRGIPKQEWLP